MKEDYAKKLSKLESEENLILQIYQEYADKKDTDNANIYRNKYNNVQDRINKFMNIYKNAAGIFDLSKMTESMHISMPVEKKKGKRKRKGERY